MAAERVRAAEIEEDTGDRVPESAFTTMEKCRANYRQGFWLYGGFTLFIRIWFAYTIVQWYLELKEE